MDFSIIVNNLMSPPILFFFMGVIAVFVHSDLHIPQPLPKLFSMYLLVDIGFHGGVELYHGGIQPEIFLTLGACMLMSMLVPLYTFFILKKKLDVHNAAAIAATYGSVSAVTFITAVSFLEYSNVDFGGHMVAAMALMESPAIICGVILDGMYGQKEDSLDLNHEGDKKHGIFAIVKEALFSGSVFLLMGSLVVGILTNETGWKSFRSFDAIFKGMLMFYLLDMGIHAAQEIKQLKGKGGFLVLFGIGVPLLNAVVAIFFAKVIGLSPGNALLFTALCSSASYIAVPAALPDAIPKANPAFSVSMALGITFPFNIIIGIPLYYYLIQTVN
ncbi:MAG: sodium-dependent bicarbonate transport family permease [Bacteriovoracaceae bacterium]